MPFRHILREFFGEKDLVDAMLAHLTEEDSQEIQRDHVDTPVDAESLTSNDSSAEEIALKYFKTKVSADLESAQVTHVEIGIAIRCLTFILKGYM